MSFKVNYKDSKKQYSMICKSPDALYIKLEYLKEHGYSVISIKQQEGVMLDVFNIRS